MRSAAPGSATRTLSASAATKARDRTARAVRPSTCRRRAHVRSPFRSAPTGAEVARIWWRRRGDHEAVRDVHAPRVIQTLDDVRAGPDVAAPPGAWQELQHDVLDAHGVISR